MSWRGKAINLDIFIGSKIIFELRHGTPELATLTAIQKVLTNGIWGSFRHEINQSILFLPPELGGIGLPNISKKICTAKLLDLRNIMFSDIAQDHAKEIELQFRYKAGVIKSECDFLLECGIKVVNIAEKTLYIEYKGTPRLQLGVHLNSSVLPGKVLP